MFGLMNGYIDHLQVVTTSIYNNTADLRTANHSTLSLLSLPSPVDAR
jgi:hypothetical protein